MQHPVVLTLKPSGYQKDIVASPVKREEGEKRAGRALSGQYAQDSQ